LIKYLKLLPRFLEVLVHSTFKMSDTPFYNDPNTPAKKDSANGTETKKAKNVKIVKPVAILQPVNRFSTHTSADDGYFVFKGSPSGQKHARQNALLHPPQEMRLCLKDKLNNRHMKHIGLGVLRVVEASSPMSHAKPGYVRRTIHTATTSLGGAQNNTTSKRSKTSQKDKNSQAYTDIAGGDYMDGLEQHVEVNEAPTRYWSLSRWGEEINPVAWDALSIQFERIVDDDDETNARISAEARAFEKMPLQSSTFCRYE